MQRAVETPDLVLLQLDVLDEIADVLEIRLGQHFRARLQVTVDRGQVDVGPQHEHVAPVARRRVTRVALEPLQPAVAPHDQQRVISPRPTPGREIGELVRADTGRLVQVIPVLSHDDPGANVPQALEHCQIVSVGVYLQEVDRRRQLLALDEIGKPGRLDFHRLAAAHDGRRVAEIRQCVVIVELASERVGRDVERRMARVVRDCDRQERRARLGAECVTKKLHVPRQRFESVDFRRSSIERKPGERAALDSNVDDDRRCAQSRQQHLRQSVFHVLAIAFGRLVAEVAEPVGLLCRDAVVDRALLGRQPIGLRRIGPMLRQDHRRRVVADLRFLRRFLEARLDLFEYLCIGQIDQLQPGADKHGAYPANGRGEIRRVGFIAGHHLRDRHPALAVLDPRIELR